MGPHARAVAGASVEEAVTPPPSPHKKLTPEQVREIRRIVAAREMSQRACGARFGISQGNVHGIINFRYWKWVK